MQKLEALKNLVKYLKHYAFAGIAIEVICTLVIGIASNKVTEFYSAWSLLIIFSSIILVLILSYKFHYLKDFPSTLIDSIINDFNTQSLRSNFSRISLINDSISKSLISLNAQTCQLENQATGLEHLNDSPIENKLCDQGLQYGLINLIQNFLQNLHNIANASQSKFTVGIYLNFYNEIPKEASNSLGSYYKSGTFVLKDDLGLSSDITSNIFNESGLIGLSLEIQSWIKACFNNGKAQFQNTLRERNDLSLYANTIPVVCSESDSIGVLFIIGENLESLPNDFDEVTKIHNRIISNWINKYNDCIRQKIFNDGFNKLANNK